MQENDPKTLITRCIRTRNSFVLYGLEGTGKTTMVIKVLKETGVRYKLLNCIECDSKKRLLSSLSSYFNPENSGGHKEQGNSAQLMEHLESFRFSSSIAITPHFFIFDNAERMKSEDVKVFSSISKIFLRSRLPIAFALITRSFETIPNLALLPKISIHFDLSSAETVSTYSNEISQTIVSELKGGITSGITSCLNSMIKEIFQTFEIFVKSYVKFRKILFMLFQVLPMDIRKAYDKGMEVEDFLMKPNCEIRQAIRFLGANPIYLHRPLQEFLEQLDKMRKEKATGVVHSLKPYDPMTELGAVPSLILLGCYMGQCIQDKNDKNLFVEKPQKSFKKAKVALARTQGGPGGIKELHFKPVSFNRLLAIVQSLFSLVLPSNSPEMCAMVQTADFYFQIRLLMNIGLLKMQSKGSEMYLKQQFITGLTSSKAEAIANKYSIKLEEFV